MPTWAPSPKPARHRTEPYGSSIGQSTSSSSTGSSRPTMTQPSATASSSSTGQPTTTASPIPATPQPQADYEPPAVPSTPPEEDNAPSDRS
eukprot:4133985-Pyramimonas_sp.AAC.1